MNIRIDLFIHSGLTDTTNMSAKLDQVLSLLTQEQGDLKTMAATVDQVLTATQNEMTVEQSAITLLQQLSAQISAAGTDPVKLQSVLDLINNNTTALAAAVAANTPAVTAPVTTPPVTTT